MTLGAGVYAPVLDGKVLPFLDIAQAVKTVSKVPSVNSEVSGNHELPGDKD